jgi:hypothetical protein
MCGRMTMVSPYRQGDVQASGARILPIRVYAGKV